MSEASNGSIVVRETGVTTQVSLRGWPEVFAFAEAMAKCPVGMVPKSYQGSATAIAAAVMTGAELGLGPMESLRAVYLVDGKPQLSAELMLRLAMRAGVRIEWTESSDTAVKARFTRSGFPAHEEAFTMRDAERAGVAHKDPWKRYPRNMLRARCVSNALRGWAPDVLGAGVYTEGEIADQPATIDATPPAVVVVESDAPRRVTDTRTPDELRAWCVAHRALVAGAGARGRAKVEVHGSAMSVPVETVRQWLGDAPDDLEGEGPPDDPQAIEAP
jgi:hypothetical protein